MINGYQINDSFVVNSIGSFENCVPKIDKKDLLEIDDIWADWMNCELLLMDELTEFIHRLAMDPWLTLYGLRLIARSTDLKE